MATYNSSAERATAIEVVKQKKMHNSQLSLLGAQFDRMRWNIWDFCNVMRDPRNAIVEQLNDFAKLMVELHPNLELARLPNWTVCDHRN